MHYNNNILYIIWQCCPLGKTICSFNFVVGSGPYMEKKWTRVRPTQSDLRYKENWMFPNVSLIFIALFINTEVLFWAWYSFYSSISYLLVLLRRKIKSRQIGMKPSQWNNEFSVEALSYVFLCCNYTGCFLTGSAQKSLEKYGTGIMKKWPDTLLLHTLVIGLFQTNNFSTG